MLFRSTFAGGVGATAGFFTNELFVSAAGFEAFVAFATALGAGRAAAPGRRVPVAAAAGRRAPALAVSLAAGRSAGRLALLFGVTVFMLLKSCVDPEKQRTR